MDIAVPAKQQVTFPKGRDEVQEYVDACVRLDILTPAVRTLQLKLFLRKHNMPIYDLRQVHDYLCQKAKNAGTQYQLQPLREIDRDTHFRWWYKRTDGSNPQEASLFVYSEIIPIAVLQTAATIKDAFPDARFFVANVQKDPFLLVTFLGQDPMVVDFWNEPGFRPK